MSRALGLSTITLAVLLSHQVAAKSPFSLVNFRKSKEVAKSSYLLTEDNGPWMIFVASFAGEAAEDEARQLVHTLRDRFKLNALLHKKHYDYTTPVKGKGFDKHGNPKQMRFAFDQAFDEIAVLVGDYDSVDDSKLQKHLLKIKTATAEELALRGRSKQNPTTRRFAGIRSIQRKLSGDAKRKRGPLGNAFATRNPMIPSETLAAQGLDPLLLQMNRGVKYSLLDNPGKYTVQVASFRGHVIIDQQKIRDIETNRTRLDERINETDEKAETLTAILRDRGVEAYVYHDRHESIVTVGSFQDVGSKRADGKIELNRQIAQIIETYGPTKRELPGSGIALAGIQPKALENGRYVFDVAPRPILVPRRSIAADYVLSK